MKTIKIALLGLGTVGSGVKNILEEKKDQLSQKLCERTGEQTLIEIKKILVRNINNDYRVDKTILTTDYSQIIDDPEIQIVVELIGGQEPASQYMTRAIEARKHVVTANKMAIALSGGKIQEKAKEKGVLFMYEASVAGTIPVIRIIQDSLVANEIQKISGIINGTTNYILSKMINDNESFESALKTAQNLGFAEADPTSDIEGYDAMYKIAILSKLAFNIMPDLNDIKRIGITGVSVSDIDKARENGNTIKFIAQAEKYKEGVRVSVSPLEISKKHPLASVDGALNAVYINCDNAGEIMLQGAGAGSRPTASAVVSDIFAIAEKL